MARREFKGNAARTKLSSGIGSADTSFSIVNNSGWPTGGANGAFSVILDGDVSGVEEHVLVANQSGGACTGVTRGVGDTSPVAHGVGADGSVIHGTTRLDYDEANRHINVTTDDNHTQYMKSDGTRHDETARHAYGGAMGTRPVPIAVGTSLLAGTSGQFAAGDHQHVIGTGAINLANMFAAGVVDAAAIGADQVGTSEIAPLAVTSAELAALAVVAGKIAAGGVSTSGELADGIVTEAKLGSDVAKAIVAEFVSTVNDTGKSVDSVSDMVLTNVPVIINHRYALHFHSNVGVGGGGGVWSIFARANGVTIGRFAEGQVTGSEDIDSIVYWTAGATQATDDFDVFLDETTDGSTCTLQAGATAPRWFTMIDLGIP